MASLSSTVGLPARIFPRFLQGIKPGSSLVSLKWPRPLQNVLIVLKRGSREAEHCVTAFAKHIHNEYPGVNVVLEPLMAPLIQKELDFPIFVADNRSSIADKIDAMATFGGDGTVLRAASLFKLHSSVPPTLSFRMGTLNFLCDWDFKDHKRAWRQMFMSGSDVAAARSAAVPRSAQEALDLAGPSNAAAWEHLRGKSLGASRGSKILFRHRIRADVWDSDGNNMTHEVTNTLASQANSGIGGGKETTPAVRAVNEVLIRRTADSPPSVIEILQNGSYLTETVADGILVSTPTGSTGYSLSAGGPIVHPFVRSLLLTPVCPLSLSFRSLLLPFDSTVTLRMSRKNRAREMELKVDGRRCVTVTPGAEVRVQGEFLERGDEEDEWHGAVPCVVGESEESWVSGLNGLLKFNRPFGTTEEDEQ